MSAGLRKLPAQEYRVETGPIQFGDDWPGIFIRGDNALSIAMALDAYAQNPKDVLAQIAIEGTAKLLRECNYFAIKEKGAS